MRFPGLMPFISRLATRAYYRFTVGGARVPTDGPVLLVANHNNSLLDPAFVTVAAQREVRFLAKSTLFTHKQIGWLVKAVASIPVYRAQDDPRLLGQNRDIFVAVHEALAEGAAVGIFPEGTSHSGSRLAPIKTGAARIALGAARRIGAAFPIVPVGLVFRDRNSVRSEVRVVVGDAFDWSDLAARSDEKFAVRELTKRIDEAMRRVTLNLDSWEDAALVHVAEQIWTAEHGSPRDSESTVSRLALTASVLQRFRSRGDAEWQDTARELRAHARMLQRMGLSPQALKEDVTSAAALRWIVLRFPLLAAIPLAALALLVYWPPLRGARWMAKYNSEGPDSVSTYHVLGVGFLGIIWTVLLSVAATWALNWRWGVATFVLLPLVAAGAAIVAERRRLSWLAVQRFFVRHLHRRRLGRMRARQIAIARHLDELLEIGTQ
ncbi:MAG: 1-acyl-sn-glycerol-3-phosphate acyltransferase [Gemmatimonadota bacterium]|nr:1-acyl-sn-glycerol-3-phosphate acyltransferase [Gemmatimonadota bacterium]